MKLTSYANHALQSLRLRRLNDLIWVGDVAHIHRLPPPHTVKIVHERGKAGHPANRGQLAEQIAPPENPVTPRGTK